MHCARHFTHTNYSPPSCKTELIQPTSQIQSLMLSKVSHVPGFAQLLRDRVETRPLVWTSLESTLFYFYPEVHLVSLNSVCPFLLKNVSQAARRRTLCSYHPVGIHSQSSMNTQVNERHE